MRFLRTWLRVERPSGVALHPSRTIELDPSPAVVFERCIGAVRDVLGGHVDSQDAERGTLEASFGLINSERLTVAIESMGENRTRVVIEARRGALSDQPRSSAYVDSLADFLLRP